MKLIIPFLIMIALAGCNTSNKVPAHIIDPDKMQDILLDIFLADAYTNERNKDGKLDIKQESAIAYNKIFSLHKITRDKFYESFNYYMGRPDLFTKMLEKINVYVANTKNEETRKFYKKYSGDIKLEPSTK